MGKPASKKAAKPKTPTRPYVTHAGVRIELPLLTGPVGTTNPDTKKFPIFNAAKDLEVVDYYLSQLAEIKFLAVACSPLQKPADKVVQAADVVQCWSSNREAAIKSFQVLMRITDADETRNAAIKPDGPTLKALVDYGDLAEKLDALRDKPKNALDYTHNGGFDYGIFEKSFVEDMAAYSDVKGRYDPTKLGNATTLLKLMQADAQIIDLRWMAYMLATAFWETTYPRMKTVAKTDKSGKPLLGPDKKPLTKEIISSWKMTMEPVDEFRPDAKRPYLLPVKVKKLSDQSARITEQDGDQFLIDLTKRSNGKAVGIAKGAKEGAVGSPQKIYSDDDGIEMAYTGRGYVQLTWWSNYAGTGVAVGLGLSLLFDPESVKQPAIAYKVMSHCMKTGDGFAHGKKFSNYFYGSTANYEGARAMVNGTNEKAKIASIARFFEAILFKAKR